jgi:hypothetical protein
MLGVKKVNYHDEYTLYVELTNNKSGYFDVTPYLDKGIFTQLQKKDYFKKVSVDSFGICWPNGQDFSADTIDYNIKNDT